MPESLPATLLAAPRGAHPAPPRKGCVPHEHADLLALAAGLLRRRFLLMDAEVVAEAAERLAPYARGARRTRQAQLVARALGGLLQLDERTCRPGSPLAQRYAFLGELLGLCPEECAPAGRAFNRLPVRVRRAFFDLLSPAPAARPHDARWTQDARQALAALHLSPLDDRSPRR